MRDPIAVLCQAAPPPATTGIPKPMKAGGYRDSAADIAYALWVRGIPVVTPESRPDPACDTDWTFPDTADAMARAITKGAKVLWTNTVLYDGHPIDGLSIKRVGQPTSLAAVVEDKAIMGQWLREHDFPGVRQVVVPAGETEEDPPLPLPIVMKPVRGRGSQGVRWIANADAWQCGLRAWDARRFGAFVLVEGALSGREVTVTVMPPGQYHYHGTNHQHERAWTLPAVERYRHVDGIIPYSGDVPVVMNSAAIANPDAELQRALDVCARIGQALDIRAPLRIDARADGQGHFAVIDVNMKPNLTGPGRPGRAHQASLVGIAASALGWTYPELIDNIAAQSWMASSVEQ